MPGHEYAAFALAVAFIVVAPAWFALTGDELAYAPAWRMFEDAGLGVCDVAFTHQGRELDRYAPFGARAALDAPDAVRHITDRTEATEVARAICSRERVSAVSVSIRCAEPDGWSAPSHTEVACP